MSGVGKISTSSLDSSRYRGRYLFANMADSRPDAERSFVYGPTESPPNKQSSSIKLGVRPRSVSATPSIVRGGSTLTSPPEGVTFTPAWVPWLSEHHRMLLQHFTAITIQIFDDDEATRRAFRSTLVPMAADTNHGFSLLAAILCLASAHRYNLGLHQDTAEIEYWKDMSMGHLRRPGVQEDGFTENVCAATALMLCICDIILNAGRTSSWRLHLQGAFTILSQDASHLSDAAHKARQPLIGLAVSLELRSLLPGLESRQCGSVGSKLRSSYLELKGLPQGLVSVLHDIRTLRLERLMLQKLERHPNSSDMAS